MKKLSLVLSFVFLFVILGGFSVVCAQDDGSNEFMLEEVVVTADKTGEQNLQKMAMSIEVMQGDKIRNTGRNSMEEILKDMPNVSTSDTGGAGVTINIRGIGMDLPVGGGTGEASVATNFDGANQSRTEGHLFGYFDIDRVEVLRGPQGTLYGKNATAGAINVISSKPTTDEVKGYAALEVGNYDRLKTEAAINIPLTDTVAARMATQYSRQGAYTKDDNGYSDTMDGVATRLQVRYMPTEDIYVNLLTNYYKTQGANYGMVTLENWEAGNYDINKEEYPYDVTRKSSNELFKLAISTEFPVGPGIVTVLPTYETLEQRTSRFGYNLPPGMEPPPGVEPSLSVGGRPWDNESKTVELRYASKEESTIKWVGGVYYSITDEAATPFDGGAVLNTFDYSTTALFGQSTIPVSDTFRLILGVRYNVDEKGYDIATGVTPPSESYDWKYFDWKVGVEKDFGEDVMGYLTVATGHKTGGFNTDFGEPTTFDMETATSAELGVKSRLMDNRLQLNGDVFYYDYENYQAIDISLATDPTQWPPINVLFLNAPGAINYGAEFDGTLLIGQGTLINMAVAYLKNEYSKDWWKTSTDLVTSYNANGLPLPHSPEFTFKVGVEHEFFFPDGSSLTPSVSYRWTDEMYGSVLIVDENIVPSYDVLDVAIAYASPNNWALNFYCNNALDSHYYTGVNGAGSGNPLDVIPAQPLTAGVALNVKF